MRERGEGGEQQPAPHTHTRAREAHQSTRGSSDIGQQAYGTQGGGDKEERERAGQVEELDAKIHREHERNNN